MGGKVKRGNGVVIGGRTLYCYREGRKVTGAAIPARREPRPPNGRHLKTYQSSHRGKTAVARYLCVLGR